MTTPSPIGPAQLARLLRLPEPTPEQAAVISAPLGPLAVIAGAGSGKSETMAARLVWLVANGMVRPDRVLGVTFTRKAAAEFADRVRSRLERLRRAGTDLGGVADTEDPFGGDPVIGTYHAYAGRLVSDNALREGLEPSMRLITPALSWQLAAQIVAAYDGPMDEIIWTPQTVTAAVLELAGDLSEHLRDTSDVTAVGLWLTAEHDALPGRITASVRKIIATQRAREQLLPLVSRYAAAKASREVLDHGDQVALAARIASRHPEVGAAERARYQVVLLDEYQDTSHAQLVLLRALFGGGHPVTAVGDPCQSIYGWRGASAGNLRRFTADFPVVARVRPFGASAPSGPAPVLQLSTSFRNSAQVLDAAAAIQEELRYEAPDVPRLTSAPDRAARGTVTCALLDTSLDEAEWVAAQAAALLAGAGAQPGGAPDGQPWPDGRQAGVRPSDIAVLCRKRSQFVPLRHALEARGIPVEVVGLGGLLAVPEVQDVVCTLRVLHDAGASDALARLLTGPRWRIGPRNLVALGRRARALASGEGDGRAVTRAAAVEQDAQDALAEAVTDLTAETGSLVEALDDLGEAAAYSRAGYARMHALAGELRRLRAHIGRPLADLTAEAERVLGLDIEVAARPGVEPGRGASRPGRLHRRGGRVHRRGRRADSGRFPGLPDRGPAGGVRPGDRAGRRVGFGQAAHRACGQGPAVAGRVRARPRPGGAVAGVPGPAAGVHAVDRQPAADPVRPARGRRGPAGAARPGRRLARRLRSRLRGQGPVRGAPADVRGGHPGGVLAGLLRLLVGRGRQQPPGTLAVPRGGPQVWRGPGRDLGRRARARRGEPAARRRRGGRLAGHPGGPPLPGGPRGRRPRGRSPASRGDDPPDPPAHGGAARPPIPPGDRELAEAWERDTGLLLAERAQRRGDGATQVPLPARLSVSSLVALARDPAELARQVRRPMPRPPASQARRGTAFHQWLEQRYGQQLLIDDSALFGPDEDDDAAAGDLAPLRSRFEQSEWAERWPQAVEVPFETLVGDRPVRGRIDAVFADAPGGGYNVVDWKTGRPPGSAAERRAVSVQLAAYRLAWAALAGVPVAQVRAAFYYVAHDQTVRPADLLDEAGLAALIEQVPAEA